MRPIEFPVDIIGASMTGRELVLTRDKSGHGQFRGRCLSPSCRVDRVEPRSAVQSLTRSSVKDGQLAQDALTDGSYG